jgi:hypothetical protein
MARSWAVLNVAAEYGFYLAYELPKYMTPWFVENNTLIVGLSLQARSYCANQCT